MEQATSGALGGVLAQFGMFAGALVVILALAFWWLKASRELREEKEGVIARKNGELAAKDVELDKLRAERDKYQQGYYALRYPGSRADPIEQEEVEAP